MVIVLNSFLWKTILQVLQVVYSDFLYLMFMDDLAPEVLKKTKDGINSD